jgi:predicted phosphodiesterase
MKIFDQLAEKRFMKAFFAPPTLNYTNNRIVIMSDCHRGTNDQTDNFHSNRHIYKFAINRYYERGYTYIELGDGDELWENKKQNFIFSEYSDIFLILNKFHKKNKLYMIYGNHDMVKKYSKWRKKNYSRLYDEEKEQYTNVFEDLCVYESIILTGYKEIYLTHGHQAELFNSTFWKVAQFLVRYIWRTLESIGIKSPTNLAEKRIKKTKTEKFYMNWAKENEKILICGHTHIPRFELNYYNTGSCVSTQDHIDAIEIEDKQIRLVKWYKEIDPILGTSRIDKKIIKSTYYN